MLTRVGAHSLSSKVLWEAAERPQYALGVLFAARLAKELKIPEIIAIEFGVASGEGLLALAVMSAQAEEETGTRILVYGFDSGIGLPPSSDPRDHPDKWRAGDYPLDPHVRYRLNRNTRLILGDVADTVPKFVAAQTAPVGFAAMDLDLYSSTRAALELFTLPNAQMLPKTALYFDDIVQHFNHSFAGELLAIDEFNLETAAVKIDRWRGIQEFTAFSDSLWASQMYIAHQLAVTPTSRRELAMP